MRGRVYVLLGMISRKRLARNAIARLNSLPATLLLRYVISLLEPRELRTSRNRASPFRRSTLSARRSPLPPFFSSFFLSSFFFQFFFLRFFFIRRSRTGVRAPERDPRSNGPNSFYPENVFRVTATAKVEVWRT